MAQNQVSTLRKGLLVLELVKQNEGITLAEVMKKLHLSKSTAFRLLTTLEEMKYIYKIQTAYFFNPKIFLGESEKRPSKGWTSLRSIYQAAENLQMSTYLGKVDGTDLVMTQVLHAPFQQSADDEMGNRSKLHQSALGKVILAHLDEVKLTSLLDKMSLEPATVNTFQDSQLFRYHLKAIHEDGYAFDDEERAVGLRCVAVPVFCNKKVIAALAIAAPTTQLPRSSVKQIATKLNVGSKAITQEIEALDNIH
ncbi:IclR family transcriptional regulator [Oceanobacillus polygoni]|uniref:IclR family transcriptional regulator n=1 Tax=Oceanobacillus polygoni TaxID=1235259 RepID=UPI0024821DE7|nr:IclR family transcriptional regulator [Oceanobacillus polygoni]